MVPVEQGQVLTGAADASGAQEAGGARRRCAVWGSPVAHSLSPTLHRAAYAALGLTGWSYGRREVDRAGFDAALDGLDPDDIGLSLTMPLKEVAFARADTASGTARSTGTANTLVRRDGGWHADNTDVEGIELALLEAGCHDATEVLVVGSGATARSAVVALAGSGAQRLTLMVRDRPRPETVALAGAVGLTVDTVAMGEWPLVDVIISTVPPAAVTGLAHLPPTSRDESPRTVLDVVYGGGPTPLQRAARARGWTLAHGTDMLLHQAAAQVTLMTGRAAPLAAMAEALAVVVDPDWGTPRRSAP